MGLRFKQAKISIDNMEFKELMLREIIEELKRIELTRDRVWKIAKGICKKHGLSDVPNSQNRFLLLNEKI